jgi:hypothetical protein
MAKVFGVSIAEFFNANDIDEELNLPLLDKIKLIDMLAPDEQQASQKLLTLPFLTKE